MLNIKLRSSKLIIKSDAQKQMVEFGFGRRFHDLKYFEVGIFFHKPLIHYLLKGIIIKFVENHQFNVIISYFKQILNNYLFNSTYLHIACAVF